jgi:hypothetical protein
MVAVDQLPLTSNGKVDRASLSQVCKKIKKLKKKMIAVGQLPLTSHGKVDRVSLSHKYLI